MCLKKLNGVQTFGEVRRVYICVHDKEPDCKSNNFVDVRIQGLEEHSRSRHIVTICGETCRMYFFGNSAFALVVNFNLFVRR